MKPSILSLAVLLTLGTAVNAQTMADALNNKCAVTWIGLDFSEATLVPTVEFAAVQADPGMMLMKWNNLLEAEAEKFNMAKALGIGGCSNNTSYTQSVNDGLTGTDLLSRSAGTLDKEKVPGMVKQYKTEDVRCWYRIHCEHFQQNAGDGGILCYILQHEDQGSTSLRAYFRTTYRLWIAQLLGRIRYQRIEEHRKGI